MGSSSRGGLQSQDEDLALFQDMRMRERNALLDSGPDIGDHGGRRAGGGGAMSRAGALASRAAGAAAVRRGSSDLLTSEIESKNDYDWLLTPPGTPLFPSLDRDLLAAPSPAAARKPSRLSASDSHSRAPGSGQSPMLVLDSSGSSASSSSASTTRVAPPRNPSPSMRGLTRGKQPQQQQQLQSSTSSLTAGMRRPSTPTRQSGVPASNSAVAARPSTPTGRASIRPSTPTRPSPSSARPSTPTSRSSSINTSSSSSITGSRPSTPTRRSPSTAAAATTTLPTMSSGRTSRGTSPMRGSIRQSPVAVVSTNSNTFRASEARPSSNSRSSTIPSSSPLLVKAELRRQTIDSAAAPGGGLLNRSYAHHSDREISSFSRRAVTSANDGLPLSSIRASMLQQQDDKSALSAKKSMRPSGMRETSFYGTSISKKSLDTAIRHMDIRRSTPGGFRSPLVSSNSEMLKCSPPIVSRHQAPGRFTSQAHGNGSSRSNGSIKSIGNSSSSSSNGSSNIGNSNSFSNRDLDMFSAATSGDAIDNFLLDSSSLDDLQSCNGDAGKSGFLEQELHL